jgi:SpoVK/Ycf46/Vps4 family AAA+-type ATPase
VVAALWDLMRERNVYRGRVLELRPRHFHGDEGAPLTVRSLPQVPRDRIVLPEGVLERIERGPHRGAADRPEPGRRRRVDRPGDRAAAVDRGLEDVDLVAMDRSRQPTNAILFELLNGMDGLAEDHDVLFVLTTNRADLLEPALAARRGRIDQAVELALPDADGRRRLALYGEGLDLAHADADAVIDELEGVSPAFIRELLRRALDDFALATNRLTQRLLGAQPPPDGEDA